MTIGVMVDGKIVQRPYSVASAPAVAGSDGYEFYVRLVQGGTFTPLLWRLPVGHAMRMIGPKGKFMLAARRRPDPRLHLVRDRQRALRGDDAPAADRWPAAAGRVPQRRVLRGRARLSDDPRGLGRHRGRIPSPTSRRCRARTTRATRDWTGRTGRVEAILGPVLDELGLNAGELDRLHLRQPRHDPGRRSDAPRARLSRGAGPQGAVLAEGQGAAGRGRCETSPPRSRLPRRTPTSRTGP